MRILFDTNVLFAAFVSHGVCAGLYEESLLHARIVVSKEILSELEEKLLSKAKLSKAESSEVIRAVRSDAELTEAPPLPSAVCRDSDDDHVLAAAHAAKVDLLVTGDQDLLVLKEFKGIPILTPRECLSRF
ncbi:MAG: putative toxin-antitoxin system toxin component, PIN family [Chthoniobacterales bacterium]